ncbi:SDR family oxidoreductase [Sphaerotilus sp.]|jgi:decaprenylphospho-beta-D-erythro-pentofuranosid-2-ulose 2-reductase|uniref:SDR family oxidoreductase n=1 Tax=Sphaerotilus sp. TaxID=2093942 RepID=UPI0025F29A83|nr:SDR family oxidoreductase [Sphaerotilus sp.]
MQRILVFGATSAIAAAAARVWAERGARVYLVGRHPGRLQAVADDLRVRAGAAGAERIGSTTADLDDLPAHAALIEQAVAWLGGLDVVLIAQGTLPDQTACETDVATTLRDIHTNALSVISLCTVLANRLAGQGSGCLAVISSVAGDRGRQSNYVYGAAKGMVSLFLQGLRNRLHRHGVAVVTIKPGFVDTPMTASFKKGALWATPAQVGRGIVAACDARRDEVYLPGFWRLIMAIVTSVPEAVFKRLKL